MSRFASAPWPLKATGLAALGLAGAAGLAGLAAAVALAGLHRLSTQLDPWAAPAWFWYFRHDPQVQRWLQVGLITAGTAALATVAGIAHNLRPPLYGASRWATAADLRRAGLRASTGILLGRAGGRPLVFGGPEHVLLYAPTRSGKGVGVVIPNLLSWRDSTVVLDVKRENWEATAGFRAALGQTVLLFDPLDAEGRTARFNPLGHIDRTDPVAVLDELQRLAVMLFPAPPNADPFWAEAARTGFIGVGAYVAETLDLPFSLGAVYAELTDGDPKARLPARVAARAAAGAPLSPSCVRALTDFCSASDNTFASTRQTLTARMNLWLNPRVRAATDVSDFDLRDLRERRISLYLGVSPDNLMRVSPLYNLLLQQLVDLNTRERPTATRHHIPVLVLLDEFARLGHAAAIAHGFAYVAGYGLRLLPVLQSPAQLRAEYGPDLSEAIIANCAAEVVFAPKDLKVAQDLSGRLGDQTVAGRTHSRPSGFSAGRRSLSESDHRRALMLPQELLQMPPDRLIVLKAGAPPVRGRKIVYWRERAFRRRVQPPPTVPARPPAPLRPTAAAPGAPASRPPEDPLTLAMIAPLLAEAGLEPLPPEGAPPQAVEAWVERFIDTAADRPLPEFPMDGDALRNRLDPAGAARSLTEGDVPDAFRRRYLTEAGRHGQGLGFYVDASTAIPSFRDRGRRLVATRSDPQSIRDMVAIADHRGWARILVTGAPGFRREAWLAGTVLGLDILGYRPTERDQQTLERRQAAQMRAREARRGARPQSSVRQEPDAAARRRMQVVDKVVRSRITDAAEQARILAAARQRLADLLERARRDTAPPGGRRTGTRPDRQR